MDRHSLAARIMTLREVQRLLQMQSGFDGLQAFASEKPVDQELARLEDRLTALDSVTRKVS